MVSPNSATSIANYVKDGSLEVSIQVRTRGLRAGSPWAVEELSKPVALAVQRRSLTVLVLMNFALGEGAPVGFEFEITSAHAEVERLLLASTEIQNASFLRLHGAD